MGHQVAVELQIKIPIIFYFFTEKKLSKKMEDFVVGDPVYEKMMSYVVDGPVPQSWKQPFYFKQGSSSLVQKLSGPCGLFAALQAHIIKKSGECPQLTPHQLLWESMLEIMKKVRGTYVFCTLVDSVNHRIAWKATTDLRTAQYFLANSRWTDDPQATLLFVLSITILVGPVWLRYFSIPDHIIDETGYTNITFVLLLLTGEILDSYIDNYGSIGGMASKGTTVQPDIGLLSNAECTVYQKIGNFFTHPKLNIWVAYYGAHFTVMISNQQGNFEFDSLSKYPWVPFTPRHPFTSLINNAARRR